MLPIASMFSTLYPHYIASKHCMVGSCWLADQLVSPSVRCICSSTYDITVRQTLKLTGDTHVFTLTKTHTVLGGHNVLQMKLKHLKCPV